MSGEQGQVARGLLAAPFATPRAIERLGTALWLYVWLALEANTSGHVCRTGNTMAGRLGVTATEVEHWLSELVEAKLIEMQTPPPYLVIKLRFWPARNFSEGGFEAGNSRESAAASGSGAIDVPVSSSKLLPEQQPEAAPATGVVGGAGEGEGLLETAQRILEPLQADQVAALLKGYPKPVVTKALARVERMPLGQIRSSRLALFRFLLVKFSRESHAPTPPHQA